MDADRDLIICRCEEVTDKAIKHVIDEGALTVDAVKRHTRAGMGLCQGRTCGRLVAQLIVQEKSIDIEQAFAVSHRPPTRPLPLKILASEDEDHEAR